MVDFFEIKDILDFIEDSYNDLNLIRRNLEGWTDKNMGLKITNRLLGIKRIHAYGKKFFFSFSFFLLQVSLLLFFNDII